MNKSMCCLIVITFFVGSCFASIDQLKLDAWIIECSTLQFRSVDYTSKVDFEHFCDALDRFNKESVSRKIPKQQGTTNFVQKAFIKPGSKVCFIGDIHGSIRSLLQILQNLKLQGFIDDDFKIIQPSFYFVFNGDFTDRGTHGVEVMYTILKLKLTNFDKVFLLRGNHEDINLNKRDGFYRELLTKYINNWQSSKKHLHSLLLTYSKFPLFAVGQVREHMKKCVKKIQTFYSYLPLALFLGSGLKNDPDFVQCCHGGIEPGYSPCQFLKNNDWRKCYDCFDFSKPSDSIVTDANKLAQYTQLLADKIRDYGKQFSGFNWSDFFEGTHNFIVFNQERFAGYKATTVAANAYCAANEGIIKAFFRGHQDRDHGFKLLAKNSNEERGSAPRNWQEFNATVEEHNRHQDGFLIASSGCTHAPIFTFTTATDLGKESWLFLSKGHVLKEKQKAYSHVDLTTYGIVTVAQSFNKWRLKIHQIDPESGKSVKSGKSVISMFDKPKFPHLVKNIKSMTGEFLDKSVIMLLLKTVKEKLARSISFRFKK